MNDPSPSNLDAAQQARRLARKERKARRRQQRAPVAAQGSQDAERGVPDEPVPGPQSAFPQQSASAAFASAVGPLGGRVARIATNMLIKQAIKFLLGAFLRR